MTDPTATTETPADAGTVIADAGTVATGPAPALAGDPVEAELLVEDVSIDGMCGVY
ncbi:MAG: mycofactocin precursor MftA [Actinomycetota bacterium]|jgi:mycofactocin precursor|nr:mycofactocin precursor MftA [Actinomycetota bacterium]